MSPLRQVILLAAVMLAAPSAGAVPSVDAVTASALSLVGDATAHGDASALFLVVGDTSATTWTVTASHASLERIYYECRDVNARPLAGGAERCGDNLVGDVTPQHEKLDFTDVTITSDAATKGGALLLRPSDAMPATVDVATSRATAIATKDPSFEQASAHSASTTSEEIDLMIYQSLKGDFVGLTAAGGAFDATGALTIEIMGLDYHLASPGGAHEGKTGKTMRSGPGNYEEYTLERDVLTLTGARVTLSTPSDVVVASTGLAVTVNGALSATDPQGLLSLPTLTAAAPGKWTGAATLDLAPCMAGPRSTRMSDFFNMGGYAFYVWGSFGATATASLIEVFAVRARRRAALDLARSTAPDHLSAATGGVL